jgi:hypothetical protein
MLVGSIASLGSHYVIDLDAINCQSGDHSVPVFALAARL